MLNSPRTTNVHHYLLAVALATLALTGITSGTSSAAGARIAKMLVGNHPAEALSRPSIGNANPNQPLDLEIHFALRNSGELEQLLKDQQDPSSPSYHQWLQTGEFEQRFGVLPEHVTAVANWLKSEGFTVVSASDGYLEFTGDVSHAQSSFGVRIASFGDGATFANVDDPVVPAEFAGIVTAVTGLDNMMQVRPAGLHRMRKAGSAQPLEIVNDERSFGPDDMRTFYDQNVQSDRDGTGSCIAIVGVSDVAANALNTFNNQFNLPPNSISRVTSGKKLGQTHDDNEVEAELDVEWSHAMAPGATQKLFLGASLPSSIAAAVKDNKCGVISISFTICGAANSEFSNVLDTQFKKAATQGQSVFISSGDNGAAGDVVQGHACMPGNFPNVSEMSADPNVTSVGGTQSTPNFDQSGHDVGYSQEGVWNDDLGASGGGASAIFAKPAYQQNFPGMPNDGNRDVPDVSLQAGQPGVFLGDIVLADSPPETICCLFGTSLAAPMMAGFVAVLDQEIGQRLGNMNNIYYNLAAQQYGVQGIANGFHDITNGNNSFGGVNGFNAGPAYDQATGLGSIDFDVFAAVVKDHTPIPQIGPLTFAKTVSFPAHKVGTAPANAKVIKLTNPAKNKNPAVMNADPVLSDTADFTITASTCSNSAVIAAGKFCTVSVQFTPQTASKTAITATLTLSDNSSNSSQVITLKGIGK